MGVLMGSFLTFSLKLYFETLMVRCFKNSGNILSRKPMNTFGWKKHTEIPRSCSRFPNSL